MRTRWKAKIPQPLTKAISWGMPAPDLNRFGLVYRLEIHLPDTQNVDTFRAIFRALREEFKL